VAVSFSKNGHIGIKTEQMTKSEGGSSTEKCFSGVKSVAVSFTYIVKSVNRRLPQNNSSHWK
jgi:hypothetical protein